MWRNEGMNKAKSRECVEEGGRLQPASLLHGGLDTNEITCEGWQRNVPEKKWDLVKYPKCLAAEMALWLKIKQKSNFIILCPPWGQGLRLFQIFVSKAGFLKVFHWYEVSSIIINLPGI